MGDRPCGRVSKASATRSSRRDQQERRSMANWCHFMEHTTTSSSTTKNQQKKQENRQRWRISLAHPSVAGHWLTQGDLGRWLRAMQMRMEVTGCAPGTAAPHWLTAQSMANHGPNWFPNSKRKSLALTAPDWSEANPSKANPRPCIFRSRSLVCNAPQTTFRFVFFIFYFLFRFF